MSDNPIIRQDPLPVKRNIGVQGFHWHKSGSVYYLLGYPFEIFHSGARFVAYHLGYVLQRGTLAECKRSCELAVSRD